MDKLLIEGGTALRGEVAVSGAKNSVLPILAAALLSREPSVIYTLPGRVGRGDDDQHHAVAGRQGGARGGMHPDRSVETESNVAPYDFVRKMRASICLLGALLGRFKSAKVSLPGGCVIGPRPIDLHLKGLAALGIDIKIEHGYVNASCPEIRGGEVFLGGRYGSSVLVTATCRWPRFWPGDDAD
jgi:UDP-N-acetylglucosamine 1-carboxyvinyltransferase